MFKQQKVPERGFSFEADEGLEPSTFCMASGRERLLLVAADEFMRVPGDSMDARLRPVSAAG
jgi:hypothetical protein